MNQSQAELVLKWYLELEERLSQILHVTQYTPETQLIFLPPLVNIVLDSCSLLDAIFREEFIGTEKRNKLTISKFCPYFESTFNFSGIKTILYQYPLLYLKPFEGWCNNDKYQSLEWWSAYNKLKHDRIREHKNATLKNAVNAICALHQVISQNQTFINALIRQDLICFGQWGKDYAKEAVYQKEEAIKNHVTALVETDLFATPVGAERFPDDIEKISPFHFAQGRKLWRYVGREF